MSKMRVDRLIVERGLAPTREKARRLVLAGEVLVNEVPVAKPGTLVDPHAAMRLRHPPSPYVGRGGEKLAGALADLGIVVAGLRVLDLGASTGGFTDCLLQHGAAEVTALDVGKAQLDWKLRTDPRVTVMEGVNARHLRQEDFPNRFDLVTIDVSFISLSKILPAVVPLLREGGRLLALVKPQFELTKEEVDAGGVVRDPDKHFRAIARIMDAARRCGLAVEDVVASHLPGLEGNREFFLSLRPTGTEGPNVEELHRRARRVCEQE
jgi:23S rRNA (cytidine1920-2'-O)/16S rRNA (cytidine1409-2'-O)-methyltransferase